MSIENSLQTNGWYLETLPMEERTYNRCLTAAENAGKRIGSNESILCEIPATFRTSEVCMAAIRSNGDALRDTPMKLRTYTLCMEAVKRWGESLSDVPVALRDHAMCVAAVTQYGMAITSVPRSLLDEELAFLAVTTASGSIKFLPPKLRTQAVCRRALQDEWRTKDTIKFIPQELLSKLFYYVT